jgi:hypothetical protein
MRQQPQRLCLGLSDQHPVEWIFMVLGQVTHCFGVFPSHGQLLESGFLQAGDKPAEVNFQFADSRLDADFPY